MELKATPGLFFEVPSIAFYNAFKEGWETNCILLYLLYSGDYIITFLTNAC
jgi:hypothetical protein